MTEGWRIWAIMNLHSEYLSYIQRRPYCARAPPAFINIKFTLAILTRYRHCFAYDAEYYLNAGNAGPGFASLRQYSRIYSTLVDFVRISKYLVNNAQYTVEIG